MNEIEIIVEPCFLVEESNIAKDNYVFGYDITIHNHSDEVVTLRNRHWEITDAHGAVEKISGVGVVGEQPVLYPGERYNYSSGTRLTTPWGCMEGSYEFEDSYGDRFFVPIPKFDLKADVVVH
ncbi:Co2+/Mg2+ efflux protein ApaG [Neisseria montereyensis]|uniref:Co2+/Mg2+ efflux protein ApaG n=1 Tax=Neisseria montereyensis TaxID=2973938 RepID=A0ABT2FGK7_9NEIS|nr:Co2+/Mg2+ efflux protein ApaG [Neisseria montereyensis]MCS4534704.1 Co2+/Mg2+ efflux protein ApaG [Neisseria montereyensis]